MSFDSLIQPPATWRPYLHPIPKPSPKPRPWQEPELGWADFATDGNWSEAIVAYLKVNWRGRHGLWTVVNTLVTETRPTTRSVAREATKEALRSMMALIRERRVMRHRRRWVAALELPVELQPSGSQTSCVILSPERRSTVPSVLCARLRRRWV
jgi:hypothetical protein